MCNSLLSFPYTRFRQKSFDINRKIDQYRSIDDMILDFPAYPVWLESAIRWSEKLQWETELELQFELWQLSDNLLFAFIANKRFSME